MEGWQSGLMYRPGKAAYPIGYREFESLPFRQKSSPDSLTTSGFLFF